MAPYRAVVTFFRGPDMKGAAAYAAWLRRQAADGRRVVIAGDFGAFNDPKSGFLTHAQVNAAFNAIGLRFDGFGTNDPKLIKFIDARPEMSFEEKFSASSAATYVSVRPLWAGATAFLTLERTDIENSRSHPVVVTKNGGFAAAGLMLHEYKQGDLIKQRWHLDPYAFLTLALGLQNAPRLDAASLNGRRLWMAHIDGDGFLTAAGPGRLCGQVMQEEVLSAIPLPVSVSIVSDDLGKDARAVKMAQDIFALPNVEAASHSMSHPLDWTSREVDARREVTASVEALGKTLPPGKDIKLITWSGLCNPPASAIKAAEALGLANINGFNGDSGFVNRFDRLYPSRTHLSPMTRQVAGMTQLNHRASNDFDLTERWSDGKLDGFRAIIDTFERTASAPERPVDVYFHFYSAHVPEALAALTHVLDWSRRQPLSHVFVSDYARIVDDFRSARVKREINGNVRVQNAGRCRTVVLPGASHVDMERSLGVIGYAEREGGLSVFLDGGRDHLIVPATRASLAYAVRSADGWIDRWSVAGSTLTFETRAFGDTTLTLAVPADGAYQISARPAGKASAPSFTSVVKAENGAAEFRYPASGHDEIEIHPTDGGWSFVRWSRYPVLAFSLAAFPVWFFVRARRRLAA